MAKFNDTSSTNNISNAFKNIASAGASAAKAQAATNARAKAAVSNVARTAASTSRSYARRSAPRAVTSSRAGSTGRSGSSGYGSTPRYSSPRPSVGNTAGGVVTGTVPAPPPKFGDAYLAGDTAYTGQASALKKALDDYQAQYGTGLQNYNTEYNTSLDKLQQDQTLKSTELNDDFASRGLLNSGVYADALNKFNQGYDTQRSDLARAKALYEQDANTDKTNFMTQNKLELDKARQAALQRFNDKYGL